MFREDETDYTKFYDSIPEHLKLEENREQRI